MAQIETHAALRGVPPNVLVITRHGGWEVGHQAQQRKNRPDEGFSKNFEEGCHFEFFKLKIVIIVDEIKVSLNNESQHALSLTIFVKEVKENPIAIISNRIAANFNFVVFIFSNL